MTRDFNKLGKIRPDRRVPFMRYIGTMFQPSKLAHIDVRVKQFPADIVMQEIENILKKQGFRVFGPCIKFAEVKAMMREHFLDELDKLKNANADLARILESETKYTEATHV